MRNRERPCPIHFTFLMKWVGNLKASLQRSRIPTLESEKVARMGHGTHAPMFVPLDAAHLASKVWLGLTMK